MSAARPAPILVGTSNWTDHERFYPAEYDRAARRRDRISFYARHFPMVEVDTTFYGIPKPSVVEGWLARTPADFTFNVKAFRSLTRHEREAGLPRSPTAEEERDFAAVIAAFRASGRLGAVHYQFPPWFTDTPAHREVLLEMRDRHPHDQVAVEFRHRSWYDGDAWPRANASGSGSRGPSSRCRKTTSGSASGSGTSSSWSTWSGWTPRARITTAASATSRRSPSRG